MTTATDVRTVYVVSFEPLGGQAVGGHDWYDEAEPALAKLEQHISEARSGFTGYHVRFSPWSTRSDCGDNITSEIDSALWNGWFDDEAKRRAAGEVPEPWCNHETVDMTGHCECGKFCEDVLRERFENLQRRLS